MNGVILNALREAKTESNVENVFDKFDIKNIKAKAKYLRYAMYTDKVFYKGKKGMESEKIDRKNYELTLGHFISRDWVSRAIKEGWIDPSNNNFI